MASLILDSMKLVTLLTTQPFAQEIAHEFLAVVMGSLTQESSATPLVLILAPVTATTAHSTVETESSMIWKTVIMDHLELMETTTPVLIRAEQTADSGTVETELWIWAVSSVIMDATTVTHQILADSPADFHIAVMVLLIEGRSAMTIILFPMMAAVAANVTVEMELSIWEKSVMKVLRTVMHYPIDVEHNVAFITVVTESLIMMKSATTSLLLFLVAQQNVPFHSVEMELFKPLSVNNVTMETQILIMTFQIMLVLQFVLLISVEHRSQMLRFLCGNCQFLQSLNLFTMLAQKVTHLALKVSNGLFLATLAN